MPLHDWKRTKGWSGLHTYWLVDIAMGLNAQLPAGYKAYIGTSPVVAIDDPAGEPDVSVRRAPVPTEAALTGLLEAGEKDPFEPDREVAIATLLEEDKSVYVESGGRMIAAVELVSPGNKDRAERKTKYMTRYLGYLTNLVHLLLIDLHPGPGSFSFADDIAGRLGIPDEPPLPAPYVVSYRVSAEPGTGEGGSLALRRTRLTVGRPLPVVPLSLVFPAAVQIDLEATYARASAHAFIT